VVELQFIVSGLAILYISVIFANMKKSKTVLALLQVLHHLVGNCFADRNFADTLLQWIGQQVFF
jgi:hypothetical protein